MKASIISGPNTVETVEVPTPTVGPKDVLVKIRACGLCGSDTFYIVIGALPPQEGKMPLGHEGAGEIVEVGREVSGFAVGDHVVINPMARHDDIIGNGGTSGALADYLLIKDAVRGRSLEVIPASIPFEVAALNEPMAVARHAVNQVAPRPTDRQTLEAVRESGRYRFLIPDQLITEVRECPDYGPIVFHLLVGGMPVDEAWKSVHLLTDNVLPRLN